MQILSICQSVMAAASQIWLQAVLDSTIVMELPIIVIGHDGCKADHQPNFMTIFNLRRKARYFFAVGQFS